MHQKYFGRKCTREQSTSEADETIQDSAEIARQTLLSHQEQEEDFEAKGRIRRSTPTPCHECSGRADTQASVRSGRMSFEESIIIPLDIYKRCRLEDGNKLVDILMDTTLSKDRKMKLYHQAQTRETHNRLSAKFPPQQPLPSATVSFGDHIVLELPLEDRPNAKAILEIFKENPSVLSWNVNQEALVNGHVVPNSNIVRIFQYFTKNLPVTSGKDVPIGAREVFETLLALNVPGRWIKQKPPSQTLRRPHHQTYQPEEEVTSPRSPSVLTPSKKKPRSTKKRRKRRIEEVDELPWTSY